MTFVFLYATIVLKAGGRMGNVTEISLRERIRLNLLSAMEQANINQVQLAERLGISKGTVNNWARGNNSPDVDMVPKICKVLGISILDLYSPTRLEPREGKQSAPLYSSEAQKLAADYDSLDGHGKKAVRAVADVEMVRCAEQAKAEPARELTEIIYTVPGYALPMSAGFGEPAGQEAPEDFSLKKAPPRGTSYIARIHGHSMEPSYFDGQLVFVHATEEIPNGKIGVFFMDGQQWVKELGDGILISHNPAYPSRPMTEDARCQGLVLGVCDESYFK